MSVLTIFILVLVFLLVITAKQHRRHEVLASRKQCRQCGAVFGLEANYCGRCGRPVT